MLYMIAKYCYSCLNSSEAFRVIHLKNIVDFLCLASLFFALEHMFLRVLFNIPHNEWVYARIVGLRKGGLR